MSVDALSNARWAAVNASPGSGNSRNWSCAETRPDLARDAEAVEVCLHALVEFGKGVERVLRAGNRPVAQKPQERSFLGVA